MRNALRREADPSALMKAAGRTARYHALDYLGMIKPLKLRIGLTNRCNSKCIMCNIWKMVDNDAPYLEHELTVGEIDKILANSSRFLSNLNHISITGGEPTLRRDFVEIFQVLHKHHPNIGISFNSNGFTTPKIMRYVSSILEFHPRLTTMISLDGYGDNHDVVRGVKNIFQRTFGTIEALKDLRKQHKQFRVEVNYVLTPYNTEDCVEIYKYCRENKIKFNPIYCVQGELYFNEEQDNVSLTENARKEYIQHFSKILEEDDSLQTREIMDQLLDRPRNFDCWAGRITFLIEENGNLFPNGGCPTHYMMGNLREFNYSFEELLASEQAQKILGITKPCRLCRLSCETMTTLQHPEALEGYRKSREIPIAPEPSNSDGIPSEREPALSVG